jgi:hypothetical protein
MHDPMCVAHKIYLGGKKKKNGNYRTPLITIWHVDPEKDGTDDSCGSFIRQRHLPKDLIEKVRKDFEFEFKHNYWFNEAGYPKFSTIGVVLDMFSKVVWNVCMWQEGDEPTNKASRKHQRFMRKYLWDILHFAENPTDSLHDSITMKYGVESPEERVGHFVSVILAWVMRKLRPWWKQPRWHIHHWKIQFHPWQRFYRRYFERCSMCGKRGFSGAAYGNWDGDKIWCEKCNDGTQKNVDQNVRGTV